MEHTGNDNRRSRGNYRGWNNKNRNREHTPDKKREEQKSRRASLHHTDNQPLPKPVPLIIPVCPKCPADF